MLFHRDMSSVEQVQDDESPEDEEYEESELEESEILENILIPALEQQLDEARDRLQELRS